jgi:predicted negative regulator of RcsB-dependent stress response
VEEYRTEEEQVEALRRWWDENGRSAIAAIIIGVAGWFGWQTWESSQADQQAQASDTYQAMLSAVGPAGEGEQQVAIELAEQLKTEFDSTTYAQFAALHLAAFAVKQGDLPEAEAQLRWVLGKASKGSDTAQVAQLRLARVLASAGDTEKALAILADTEVGSYQASYAAAQGDILFSAGRNEEAREAYGRALLLAASEENGLNLPVLRQKFQNLTPVPTDSLNGSIDVEPNPADAADAEEG